MVAIEVGPDLMVTRDIVCPACGSKAKFKMETRCDLRNINVDETIVRSKQTGYLVAVSYRFNIKWSIIQCPACKMSMVESGAHPVYYEDGVSIEVHYPTLTSITRSFVEDLRSAKLKISCK